MKTNREGFTLIELIAIILILGIIILISMPVVAKIVEESRKNAFRVSTQNIADSAFNQYELTTKAAEYYYANGVEYTTAEKKLSYTGKKPVTGRISVTPKGIVAVALHNGVYCATKPGDSDKVKVEKKSVADCITYNIIETSNTWEQIAAEYEVTTEFILGINEETDINSETEGRKIKVPVTADSEYVFETPEFCTTVDAVDTNPGTISGTGTSVDPYLIESIEDLVALSNNVNAGNTYTGKYFSLLTTLDFAFQKSYANYQTLAFGDINGNGTTEQLMTELTTAAGFTPIGNNTAKFRGIFNGNNKCIKNLYINRPTTSYVGLFGLNYGVISTLNLVNVNITGKDYTAGYAGYNDLSSKIIDGSVTGNVTGNNYVGLVEGRGVNFSEVSSIFASGDVTGADYVGGLTGYSYYAYVRGIMQSGNIVATGTHVGRTVGSVNDSGYISTLSMDTVKVNGSVVTSNIVTSINGSDLSSLNDLNNINLAEASLDTYIGGDTDNNGWYWDYDASWKIIHKQVSSNPLTFTLTGSGTTVDPYLISNVNELKMATLKLNAVYKLINNIDLTGVHFYMLGSYINNFTGTLLGNYKSITNLTLNVTKGTCIGFSGYNKGTIKELSISNFNVTASHYTGALAGVNYGEITLTNVSSTSVTGTENVGGYAGLNELSSKITDSTFSGNVIGTKYVGLIEGRGLNFSDASSVFASGDVTGSDYVGGIAGLSYYGYVRGVMQSGNIIATGTHVGRSIGSANDSSYISNLSMNTVKINGSTVTSNLVTSLNGVDLASLNELNDINLAEAALDTYIGGDTDNNGWYWDYDSSWQIVHKEVSSNPLTFSLSGGGTTASPYLISNANELKMATLQLNSVYKLTSSIDLTGVHFYMLGSYVNNFTGTFQGGANSINNLTLNVTKGSYIGFCGYNKGTIKGLILNANITGQNFTGGLVGYTKGTISDIIFNGNVSGSDYVGLIGGTGYTGTATSVVASGDVTGHDIVGGLFGRAGYTTLKGVYRGGSITSSGSSAKRISGTADFSTLNNAALSTTTINGATVSSTSATSANGLDIASSDLTLQVTYSDREFNFTDETKDYIWYMDAGIAKFREGNL